MSAISLTPFIAPAAGTIAFLLLLCVSIGAVFALTPFRARGKLVTDDIDEHPGAGSVSFAVLHDGLATDDEATGSRPAAKQASVSRPESSLRETDSTVRSFGEVPAESSRDVPRNPIRIPEQSPYSAPADRWWGINE